MIIKKKFAKMLLREVLSDRYRIIQEQLQCQGASLQSMADARTRSV